MTEAYKNERAEVLKGLGVTQVDLVQTIDIALKCAISHDEISEARAVEVWERLAYYSELMADRLPLTPVEEKRRRK